MKENKTTKQEKLSRLNGMISYCNSFTLTISFLGLLLAVIGFSRMVLAGILFCVTITFAHYVLFLYERKGVKKNGKN